MKHRNLMMVAVFAAGLGGLGGALAQGAGCGPEGGMGMKSGMMQDGMKQGGIMDPAARAEQRLTQLKDVIKPNAQQEPLWQAFAEKSKAEAEKGYKAMRERASQDKTMTAPERMAQMQNSMKDRAASGLIKSAMSYQVLARKWRPKSFATLVGQEHVVGPDPCAGPEPAAPRLSVHRHARRGQDHAGAHHGQGAELRDRRQFHSLRRVQRLHRDRRRPLRRLHRTRCGLEPRRRRHDGSCWNAPPMRRPAAATRSM
jgi:hypothetical protein